MNNSKINKIGVLTSGGDAPGMNAAIRSVVRSCIYNNVIPVGIHKGYKGLVRKDFETMQSHSVSKIIQMGGTILISSRLPEFATDKPELSVIDILQIGMPTESKTELRRLILQNAVTINENKATEPNQIISTDKPLFVRVGRKTFFKIVKK